MAFSTPASGRAQWIWRPRRELPEGFFGIFAPLRTHAAEKDRFVLFRRAFDLSSAPYAASLDASADGRYQLWVNGTLVGRGPARCNPNWQTFDSYDITPLLRPGANVVALLVRSYGADNSWYELPRWETGSALACGGVWVRGEVEGPDRRLVLDSNASWHVLDPEAWSRDTPHGGPGSPEVLDLGKLPVGWQEAGFDDSDWAAAQPLSFTMGGRNPAMTPFPVMEQRPIPVMREEARSLELVSVGEVEQFEFPPPGFRGLGWIARRILTGKGPPRGPVGLPEMAPNVREYLGEQAKPGPQEVLKAVWTGSPPPGSAPPPELAGNTDPAAQSFPVAFTMAAEPIGDLDSCSVEGIPRLVSGEGEATIRTVSGRAVTLVFDAGTVVAGRPRVDFTAPGGGVVDIGVCEELHEGRLSPIPPSPLTALNADRVIARAGRQQWEKFEKRGFRYLQLTVRNADKPIELHRVDVLTSGYPIEPRGRFACSDDRLTRIWQMGADTTAVCMHDGYEDGPYREGRSAMGDARVQALVNYVAFGDRALAAKTLRDVARTQRPDGVVASGCCCDFASSDSARVMDFCLDWVSALREYVRFTGDHGLASELFGAVQRQMAWFEQWIDADGLISGTPHWWFIDWADSDKRGQCTVINALYYRALGDAAELALMAAHGDQAEGWRSIASNVKAAVNELLWDEERGVYIDARIDGQPVRRVAQVSTGAVVAYGIAPPERREPALAYVTDPQRVKLTTTGMNIGEEPTLPHFDDETDVVRAQPYGQQHLNAGLAMAGLDDLLVENIRNLWGMMLDAGSSTTLELFEVYLPDHSRAHGYGSHPTFQLSTQVLGVRPSCDGFGRVTVEPRTASLLTWANGSVPTPAGDVEVAWSATAGRRSVTIDAPDPGAVDLYVPDDVEAVSLNGVMVWEDGHPVPVNSTCFDGMAISATEARRPA